MRSENGRRRSASPSRKTSAERAPDPRAVDLRAAERALVAARHLPRDLRAGPRLEHDAARVVDRALPRSRRRRPTRSSPSSSPSSRRSVSSSVRPLAFAGYRSSQAATFGSRRKIASARCLRQVRCGVAGTSGVWTRWPFPSKTGAVGVAGRRRGSRRGRARERTDDDADEPAHYDLSGAGSSRACSR